MKIKQFFNPKFRIVSDTYLGYEVQIKRWYSLFYFQMDLANTHSTIEKAQNYINKYLKTKEKQKVYLEYDKSLNIKLYEPKKTK